MNFSSNEIILESQRGRLWSPLVTQQIRLRHISQIWCLNLQSDDMKTGSFYFTLHLTMMSAPFFTSECTHGPHPKWQDIIFNKFPSTCAIVLRVWQHKGDNAESHIMLLTWGIHLSGLVYIGNKSTDIHPSLFNSNTVVFYMFGGFLTSTNCIKDNLQKFPSSFVEQSNMLNFPKNKSIFKCSSLTYWNSDIKKSYTVEKMRKLHYLEIMIKNKTLDVQQMANKITELDVSLQTEQVEVPASPTKTTSQLLTMNSLNRMLQVKPTRVEKLEVNKLIKQLEIAKFRCKLLKEEKDKKQNEIKLLNNKYTALDEKNLEKESTLMEDHHTLSRDKEKLKEDKLTVMQHREALIHKSSQLQHRKRQLLQQLLWIYPIKETKDNKYVINNMYLPNSDMLTDVNDDGISVALGYVAHILTMCSMFLQVPLRYPIVHYGSRSVILDQITANLPEQEFPLFTKGKDRMQFTYGVYLLNKNISQLRWLYFMHTPDLKLTLPNLLNFLQGYKEFKQERFLLLRSAPNSQTNLLENIPKDESIKTNLTNLRKLTNLNLINFQSGQCSDPVLDCIRQEKLVARPKSPTTVIPKKVKGNTNNDEHTGSSLSEILAIPEAFLNKQMSRDSFKNYLSLSSSEKLETKSSGDGNFSIRQEKIIKKENSGSKNNCDTHVNTDSRKNKENYLQHCDSIEEGTDLLNPKSILNDLIIDSVVDNDSHKNTNIHPEVTKSTECIEPEKAKEELEVSTNLITKEQNEFMQNWLRTGPALVCSDQNLYPEEFLGATSTEQNDDCPLTARTDALLNTKSFNLVKPKH